MYDIYIHIYIYINTYIYIHIMHIGFNTVLTNELPWEYEDCGLPDSLLAASSGVSRGSLQQTNIVL